VFDPELETLTWARNEAKSWSLEFDRSLSTETRGALFRRCGCRSDAFGADAIRPLCRSGRTLLRRGARRSPTAARGTPDEPRMVTDHGS